MSLPREKPDAITVPKPFLPNGRAPHTVFKQMFAKVLGSARVAAGSQGNMYFLFAKGKEAEAGLHFPTMHPLHPEERYEWFVVQESRDATPLAEPRAVESWRDEPQAVKFGYLRDEDSVLQPPAHVKADFMAAAQAQQLEYQKAVRRHSELLLKSAEAPLAPEERDEMDHIQRYFQRFADDGPGDPSGRPPQGGKAFPRPAG